MLQPLCAVLAGLAFVVLPAQLLAAIIPPIGLAPGSQYQLIFVTQGRRSGTSLNIADYNAFVTAEAALNPSLPATTWHAVASTSSINANVNAPSVGLPVYNTQGIEVASAATGLYTPSLLNRIEYDQHGVSIGLVESSIHDFPFTGSLYDGTGVAGNQLGTSAIVFGSPYLSTAISLPYRTWASEGGTEQDFGSVHSFYALSDPITVPIPEPASMTLLGMALLLFGGHKVLGWRIWSGG